MKSCPLDSLPVLNMKLIYWNKNMIDFSLLLSSETINLCYYWESSWLVLDLDLNFLKYPIIYFFFYAAFEGLL